MEKLGYYDFMAYLEVPFFNIGGPNSIDRLTDRCGLNEDSHILDVGCGTGGNSVYLAKKYGCRVTGVDISELMVEQAKKRAAEEGLETLLSFSVGDAYSLDFPDETFDLVITLFVSQFLEPARAFPEFKRVLRRGGHLAINEMYRESNIPPEHVEAADFAEDSFRDLTELPFRIRTPEAWREGFDEAGFVDVSIETVNEQIGTRRGIQMIGEFGGWRKLSRILWRTLILGLRSKKIWEKYARIDKAKQVMFRDKTTKHYFGYLLGLGRKE